MSDVDRREASPPDAGGSPADALSYEDVCRRFYGETTKRLRQGGAREIGLGCSVGREQGLALYRHMRTRRPTDVLEVGLAWGGSAIHLGAGLRDNGRGRHLAIDPFQESWSDIGESELERLGLAVWQGDDDAPRRRFELVRRRSDVVLPELWEAGRRFDYIFIDGDHSFAGVFVDAYYCEKLLAVGGMLTFDDAFTGPIGKVRSYIASNMANLKLLGEEHGRFAYYEKTGPDERDASVLHPF